MPEPNNHTVVFSEKDVVLLVNVLTREKANLDAIVRVCKDIDAVLDKLPNPMERNVQRLD